MDKVNVVKRSGRMVSVTLLVQDKGPKFESNPVAEEGGRGSAFKTKGHFKGSDRVRGKAL